MPPLVGAFRAAQEPETILINTTTGEAPAGPLSGHSEYWILDLEDRHWLRAGVAPTADVALLFSLKSVERQPWISAYAYIAQRLAYEASLIPQSPAERVWRGPEGSLFFDEIQANLARGGHRHGEAKPVVIFRTAKAYNDTKSLGVAAEAKSKLSLVEQAALGLIDKEI